jgi:hypothetical protein
MAEANINPNVTQDAKNVNFLIPITTLWGLALLILGGFFWMEAEEETFGDLYLLPWCLLAGIVIIAPSLYFFIKRKFDLFNPLIFGAFSYVLPAFVGGGVILAFGWSDPYYLTFVEDPEKNLPLSLMYVAVGYLGMTLGYFLPVGKLFSKAINTRLPRWDWRPSQVWLSGLLLLAAGFGVNILGFVRGLVGYQRADTVEAFDGSLIFLLILLAEGNILLWLAIFQTKKKTPVFYVVLVILIALIPLRAALLGSRSSLMLSIIPIAMAFSFSGRKLKWQHTSIFGVLLILAMVIGIIYGTTFRNIKGSEARMEAGDYIGQITATLDYLSTQDNVLIFEEGTKAMAERIENLSALGVVVSNYEKLAPYEAAYGLENNITNDILYSFIPRFVWSDKPSTSDARAYSDLYFNFGENSFPMTPFGDLLRNFGPVGIPLGMLLVGIYLRTIYATFIETETPTLWKKVAYYPLLTVISYESFYATLFPSIIRVSFVLIVSLYLVNLIVKRTKATD